MTVTKCVLRPSTVRYTFGQRQGSNVRAQWGIETDDPTQGGISVLNEAQAFDDSNPGPVDCNLAVPNIYDTFSLFGESDPSLFVNNIDLEQESNNKRLWMATVRWQPLAPGGQPTDNQPPLSRPAVYWFEGATEVALTEYAYLETDLSTAIPARDKGTLQLISDAAGSPLEPLQRTLSMSVLNIQLNYANGLTAMSLNQQYQGTVNEAITDPAPRLLFGLVDEHRCKFEMATSSAPRWEQNQQFYTVTIRLRLSQTPFYVPLVNAGFNARTNPGLQFVAPIKVPEYDAQGNATGKDIRPASPRNLQLDGQLLADGTVGNYIDYRVEEAVDYTGLEALIYTPP